MNREVTKREAFRAALERDYGCKPGQVHEGYGAECASAAHAPALYRTFGCDHVAHLADALAPLLAGWLAEAWDQALGHVWDLADPAYSVVMTQAAKYVVVEADIIQARRENPYRAAPAADAAETTGGGV